MHDKWCWENGRAIKSVETGVQTDASESVTTSASVIAVKTKQDEQVERVCEEPKRTRKEWEAFMKAMKKINVRDVNRMIKGERI